MEDLLKVIKEKPDDVELVITGRKADPKIIEAADLVTEMKEIRHYSKKGVMPQLRGYIRSNLKPLKWFFGCGVLINTRFKSGANETLSPHINRFNGLHPNN